MEGCICSVSPGTGTVKLAETPGVDAIEGEDSPSFPSGSQNNTALVTAAMMQTIASVIPIRIQNELDFIIDPSVPGAYGLPKASAGIPRRDAHLLHPHRFLPLTQESAA